MLSPPAKMRINGAVCWPTNVSRTTEQLRNRKCCGKLSYEVLSSQLERTFIPLWKFMPPPAILTINGIIEAIKLHPRTNFNEIRRLLHYSRGQQRPGVNKPFIVASIFRKQIELFRAVVSIWVDEFCLAAFLRYWLNATA